MIIRRRRTDQHSTDTHQDASENKYRTIKPSRGLLAFTGTAVFIVFCYFCFLRPPFETTPLNVSNDCIILMPTYSRANYLREALAALEKVQHNCAIIISQDGSIESVSEIIEDFISKQPNRFHLKHRIPFLGIPMLLKPLWHCVGEYKTSFHLKDLLTFAFETLGAKITIIVEEDILLSPDAVNFAKWAISKSDEEVLTVGLRPHCSSSNVYQMSKSMKFESHGWAIAKEKWEIIKSHWTKFNNWDLNISKVSADNAFFHLHPCVARSNHIGSKGINYDGDLRDHDQYASDETTYDETTFPIIC